MSIKDIGKNSGIAHMIDYLVDTAQEDYPEVDTATAMVSVLQVFDGSNPASTRKVFDIDMIEDPKGQLLAAIKETFEDYAADDLLADGKNDDVILDISFEDRSDDGEMLLGDHTYIDLSDLPDADG